MSQMVFSEVQSWLVMASRVHRQQASETQLLSEEWKSIPSPAPKMPYFPLQTKWQGLLCCAQSLACTLGTNIIHPSACPCQYLARPYIFVSKYHTQKNPLTGSTPKWILYQQKGLKANQTKTDDWENSTLLPPSVAHQAKPCHGNGRREGRQGQTQVPSIWFYWFTVFIWHWNYISCSFWHHQEMLQCHKTRSRVTSGEI